MTVEVWWARPSDAGPALERLLDPVELARAARYRRRVDRDRSVVAAALVRRVVGEHLGVEPAQVPVDRTCDRCGKPHGRPRVPGSELHVSVTHGGDAVAVALATVAVGVDVEPRDPEIGDRLFFEHWVAKEAILKASGDGLMLPMEGLTLAGDRPPYVLTAWAERPELVSLVTLHPLRGAPPGHESALALIGAGPGVTITEH